jgi:hypothetical protein
MMETLSSLQEYTQLNEPSMSAAVIAMAGGGFESRFFRKGPPEREAPNAWKEAFAHLCEPPPLPASGGGRSG